MSPNNIPWLARSLCLIEKTPYATLNTISYLSSSKNTFYFFISSKPPTMATLNYSYYYMWHQFTKVTLILNIFELVLAKLYCATQINSISASPFHANSNDLWMKVL